MTNTNILKKIKVQRTLLLMVLPGVLWMIIFNYLPMYGIIIAFKEFKIYQSMFEAPWVGFYHFIEFFKDEDFFLVMKNTLGMSFLKLLIGFPLPIAFAVLLNELKLSRFKKNIQTISYLPHFLSWVVLGGIMITWTSEAGLVNEVLLGIGIIQKPIAFLGDPKYFWGIAIASDIWKEIGWNAIIYLAAIAAIDVSMYEAAVIDGANRFQKIKYITLPSIAPTIAMLFILAVSGVLNSNFDQVFVLNNPLNSNASEVLDLYVYRTGIRAARYSYATAIGLFKSVVAFALLFTANKVTRRLTGNSLF
ncbi:ABC transporter permease [Vallitalea okinawensis]|uniref:ABC transporter permease n=1 Tax=Vallitalea okinawensis TaxID=2078660 RepID=UPI001FA901E1|nr:ABC transporter permease subunit [Vallitalea okinawensis]